MAKVFLEVSTDEYDRWFDYPAIRLKESFREDAYGHHQLTNTPEDADIILFASNRSYHPAGLSLYNESLYKRFPERSVLISSIDRPSPLHGGLCASWPASFESGMSGLAFGWCYHHPNAAEPLIDEMEWSKSPKYLWSFAGSSLTHPVRKQLLSLRDSKALIKDTGLSSHSNLRGSTSKQENYHFLNRYMEILKESAFIACPRGVGASSMRIFEAMRAGRPPVIISDEWTPPPFINWKECSLQIAEKHINFLPEILREHVSEAEELGHRAREEWSRVFGKYGLFHHTVEASLLLLEQRSNSSNSVKAFRRYLALTKKPYSRLIARHLKKRLFYLTA